MSSDDYYDYDDDDENAEDASGSPDGDAGEAEGRVQPDNLRTWLDRRRGWLVIVCLTIIQGVFALVMINLGSDVKPVSEIRQAEIRDLAIEMLGHEVGYNQIYQLVPMRGGKRMTVGMDIVLVLGQLPEERVEGAERPTPEEFEIFMAALRDLEPHIRSRVNSLLQKIPPEEFGKTDVYKTIKDDIKAYANDTLAGLDFGAGVRRGIGKRRVTEVLLPMFVRQFM